MFYKAIFVTFAKRLLLQRVGLTKPYKTCVLLIFLFRNSVINQKLEIILKIVRNQTKSKFAPLQVMKINNQVILIRLIKDLAHVQFSRQVSLQ